MSNKRTALNHLSRCKDIGSALFGLGSLMDACDMERLNERDEYAVMHVGALLKVLSGELAEATFNAEEALNGIDVPA